MGERSRYIDLLIARLQQSAQMVHDQWNNPVGTRTRHFVIDDVFPPEICTEAYAAFPKDAKGFARFNTFREKKKTSVDLDALSPILGDLTYTFQDIKVVELVARLVGFSQIEPDPKLYAGGLSIMLGGDFLNPHIDNSHDAKRQRYRRLNLLYYVSPDWRLENGGNFELWNDERTAPKTIVSKANRLVVMETNRLSWHSVSPVRSAAARCCISNYYFSKISPDATNYYHVTSYSGRPEQKLRKVVSQLDNSLRNVVSKTLKITTGKRRK